MHKSLHLRQQIAQEAARLLLGGYASDFSKARQRAARQLNRGRMLKEELPTYEEIQGFLLQLRSEQSSPEQNSHLSYELEQCLLTLQTVLQDDQLLIQEIPDTALLTPGFIVKVFSALESDVLEEYLIDAGSELNADLLICHDEMTHEKYFRLKTTKFELELYSQQQEFFLSGISLNEFLKHLKTSSAHHLNMDQQQLLDWSFAFELLPLLSGIHLDPAIHPEGDLTYHSQQCYELGFEQEPYDAEFLEACLFHDLGFLRNFHHPQAASVNLLTGLATERTLFLIGELPAAHDYLLTGEIKASLRKSPDFDLLIELAKIDRQARVPGKIVQDLAEIEQYLQSIQ